jgi:hypothetical protein
VVEASFFMFPGDRMIEMVGHAKTPAVTAP